MKRAERTIRSAVGLAEEISGERIDGVALGFSTPSAEWKRVDVETKVAGRPVDLSDLSLPVAQLIKRNAAQGRLLVHATPIGCVLDGAWAGPQILGRDGEALTSRLHTVTLPRGIVTNITTLLERCELQIDRLIFSPVSLPLVTASHEEQNAGCVVVDIGAHLIGVATIHGGAVLHAACIRSPMAHATLSVAKSIGSTIASAETLKTVHGGLFQTPEDERILVGFDPLHGDDDGKQASVSRARLISTLRPHAEATILMVRDAIAASGIPPELAPTVILTGGGSQLPGLRELARSILGRTARLGRARGALDIAQTRFPLPGFTAAFGLLAWETGCSQPKATSAYPSAESLLAAQGDF